MSDTYCRTGNINVSVYWKEVLPLFKIFCEGHMASVSDHVKEVWNLPQSHRRGRGFCFSLVEGRVAFISVSVKEM